MGLSGTVQVAEQFPGVLSVATPRRAGSTAKWSRLLTRTSMKVAVNLMVAGAHTEWIGNEKSDFTEAEHYQVFLEGFEFAASAWLDRFDWSGRQHLKLHFRSQGGWRGVREIVWETGQGAG